MWHVSAKVGDTRCTVCCLHFRILAGRHGGAMLLTTSNNFPFSVKTLVRTFKSMNRWTFCRTRGCLGSNYQTMGVYLFRKSNVLFVVTIKTPNFNSNLMVYTLQSNPMNMFIFFSPYMHKKNLLSKEGIVSMLIFMARSTMKCSLSILQTQKQSKRRIVWYSSWSDQFIGYVSQVTLGIFVDVYFSLLDIWHIHHWLPHSFQTKW